MSIKYYHLAKDETPPEEFCAIRDVGGEPSEYMFYVPEAENDKMRHDLEEANNQAEEVCIENAKLRELAKDFLDVPCQCLRCEHYNYEEDRCDLRDRARELGVEVSE